MKTFSAPLLKVTKETSDVMTFRFSINMDFKPGQFVMLKVGERSVAYSISSSPTDNYIEISMKMGSSDFKKALGSAKIGSVFEIKGPYGVFLFDESRDAIMLAGGIGITPIKAMAQALQARGTPFMLHYTARRPEEMAYRDRLAIEFPQQLRLYFSRVAGLARMDVDALVRSAAEDAVFYVCGPATLIGAVASSARQLGIAPERVQFESFS